MRTSYLAAAAIVSALGIASLAAGVLPAAAESEGGSSACAPASGSVTLNLDAIPVQTVTGARSVRGVAGDDDDCGHGGSGNHAEHGEYGDDD